MKRILVAVVLCLVVIWYALLDRCLIAASGMPMSSGIWLLLLLQVAAGAFLLMSFIGQLPIAPVMKAGSRNMTMNLAVFFVPALFFLVSPVLISEVLNREHYGIDKFVVDAHIARDLGCCINPLSPSQSAK